MSNMQMNNSIVEWERRIAFEEEQRKNHPGEPYVNYLAAPQDTREERPSFFAQVFGRAKKLDPALSTRKEKPCKDPTPC